VEQVSPAGRPVFLVAEGLLMYLHESDVRALIQRLHREFPGCHLVFDAFSRLTADRIQAHPSLQKTGAGVHWGIDDPREIERWVEGEDPGIRLKEEWFFNQSPDLDRLGWFYRWMFRMAGSIPAAPKAHRILYYTL
jgi:O-methyltransferase involved in polyketide biosynthesis